MTMNDDTGIKTTATISLLAGVWLFLSPWVYRVSSAPNAWNSWIFGILIVLFSLIRLWSPEGTRSLSVVNLILGAWTFVSPWVYGYMHDTGRFVNSLCVGAIVFVVAIIGSSMGHTATHEPPPLRP